MCEWFDETCGQLLGHLETRGLRENTIVLFAVDNGWIQRPNRRGFAARSKRSPYEGGVRTPIMVSWLGHVAPGHHEALASTIDLAPTILRACGASGSDSLPGRDLIAEATTDTESKRAIFGEIFSHDVADIDRPSQSLRYRWSIDGRWKLIEPTDVQATPELYDIVTDPHEEHDLASSQADRIKKMRQQLDGWWRPDRTQ